MVETLAAQLEQLRRMKAQELRSRYGELFGHAPTITHRDHLVRRIGWKLQTLAEGDLSERAKGRALEIANRAELKGRTGLDGEPIGGETTARKPRGRDPRLPPPGTELRRVYGGREIIVKVLADGFECQGQRYGSLSAAASGVTGTRWNGLVFFGCAPRRHRVPVPNQEAGRVA